MKQFVDNKFNVLFILLHYKIDYTSISGKLFCINLNTQCLVTLLDRQIHISCAREYLKSQIIVPFTTFYKIILSIY